MRAESRTDTPALDALEARFRADSPIFREAVTRTRTELGEAWAADFDDVIAHLLPDRPSLEAAVSGYTRFALEVLRLQARFDATGAYEPRSYADVAATVYDNDDYMNTSYLPGLLLSNYLWPHHYRQLRFFELSFLAQMSREPASPFYDVGVGTGLYSRLTLIRVPGSDGRGIDISPSSKAFAERHVDAFGAGARYSVDLRDIERDTPDPRDWVICVEVLEHLEDPVSFLVSLRRMLRPGGLAFIGTALNAANADHIYLYRTVDDVGIHLEEAGFRVQQSFSATASSGANGPKRMPEVAAFLVA